MNDGLGASPDHRFRMSSKPGSHVAYAQASDLVVEWYDFGDHAPYESANLLTFDRLAQQQLAGAIGLLECPSPDVLASEVARKFSSYFEVKAFAAERGIPFTSEVDFWP